MSDTTQVPEQPQAPTKDDLAGLFQQFNAPQNPAPAEPAPHQHSDPAPENGSEPAPDPAVDTEPVEQVQELQEFEAEPETEPAAEPAAPPAPAIPPPPGMTQAQVDAFGQLPPDMQSFVAGQEAHRTGDYQRKTADLAQQRREFEALRAQYNERLQQQIDVLSTATAEPPKPPDPALRDTDYEEYERQRDNYIVAVTNQQQQSEQLRELQVRQAAEQQQQAQQFAQEQGALLPSLIPETADPARRAQILQDVATYATGEGYAPQQLAGFTARDLKMLHQSMLWERASKAAPDTGKKVTPPAPRTQRPGTATPPAGPSERKYGDARKAFDKNPSRNTLAGLFHASRPPARR